MFGTLRFNIVKSSHETPHTAFDSADPPRNFSLSIGERIRALTIGTPAYALRKRSIEDLEARYLGILRALRIALVRKNAAEREVCQALLAKADTFDLVKLNTLITTHNRYYPIEANLPVDPRTGEYLLFGRPWLPEATWTAHRLVDHALAYDCECDSADAPR